MYNTNGVLENRVKIIKNHIDCSKTLTCDPEIGQEFNTKPFSMAWLQKVGVTLNYTIKALCQHDTSGFHA